MIIPFIGKGRIYLKMSFLKGGPSTQVACEDHQEQPQKRKKLKTLCSHRKVTNEKIYTHVQRFKDDHRLTEIIIWDLESSIT